MIHQIDKGLRSVRGYLLLKMHFHHIRLHNCDQAVEFLCQRGAYCRLEVHNLQVRLVSQRSDFRPEHRHTTTNLDKAKLGCETILVYRWRALWFNKEQLLSFVEVGNVSFLVDTTTEVAGASTET